MGKAEYYGLVPHIRIELSDFKISPREIRLRPGRAVILDITNSGPGKHDFTAPDFFEKAVINPADRRFVTNGKVKVAVGDTVAVNLVPAAGNYSMKCGHLFHATSGMSGGIHVTW
jgi:plastocyanin